MNCFTGSDPTAQHSAAAHEPHEAPSTDPTGTHPQMHASAAGPRDQVSRRGLHPRHRPRLHRQDLQPHHLPALLSSHGTLHTHPTVAPRPMTPPAPYTPQPPNPVVHARTGHVSSQQEQNTCGQGPGPQRAWRKRPRRGGKRSAHRPTTTQGRAQAETITPTLQIPPTSRPATFVPPHPAHIASTRSLASAQTSPVCGSVGSLGPIR